MQDRVCADHTIRHHSGVVRSESTVEMAVLQLLVYLTLQKNCKKQLTKRPRAVIITYVVRDDSPENPKYGGLAQLGAQAVRSRTPTTELHKTFLV